MDNYDTELFRAMNLPKEITESWAQVFLKSGQVMFVKAKSWMILDEVLQDEIEGDDDSSPLPEFKVRNVVFYDENDESLDDEIVLPWENVAAIRFFSPIKEGAERINL